MTSFLGYNYSRNLTEAEKAEVEKKTEKARQAFSKGFVEASRVSVPALLFLVTASISRAADVPVETPPSNVSNVSKNVSAPAYVGGASLLAALDSGDYALGAVFGVGILVLGLVFTRNRATRTVPKP
jgi:hypothetical protein